MKQRAFTLIELIFVIVIIGVLAAVAVPKFQNLKRQAEVNSIFKVVTDAATSVPASYLNLVDLEGEKVELNLYLDSFLQIEGNKWHFKKGIGNGRYWYGDKYLGQKGGVIAEIDFHVIQRELNMKIYCNRFTDSKTAKLCRTRAQNSDMGTNTKSYEQNVTW